jgi:4-hydroxybenzoate polyprenyltransferase
MKVFKLILWGLVIVLAVVLGFSIIGFIYSALWYLFWIGAIALAGYIGYKIFKKDNTLELEGRDDISQIELENAKIVKSLEDFKHKYQSK